MVFEILRKQHLKFYNQGGIRYFEPFIAVDKYKKPLNISWNHKTDSSSIVAGSSYNDDSGIYDMYINRNIGKFKGISIVANPKHKEIGEVLNLASLVTFKENHLPDYKVFALRDSIQFYAKYGFNLLSSNINEIIHNLKFLAKIKDERFFDTKKSAQFFLERINKTNEKDKNKYITLGNNLISDYLRNFAREGVKIDGDNLYNHSHMHFSTIDTIRNRDYLNELLDKHEINYTI